METQRWLNQSQPQTLFIATWLLYADAVFAVLDILRYGTIRLPLVLLLYFAMRTGGSVLAGRGIANDRRYGYYLGLACAATPFLFRGYYFGNPFSANALTLLFEIALVALLLHPQSREYQKIWFK